MVEGTTKTSWSGKARAQMNGSGNLRIRCTGRVAGASEESTIELGFGNATFDGPRTYKGDDFTSDGSVRYEPPEGFAYSSNAKGAGCTLVLSEAPVDASGSSVPVGSRVAATFACSALVPGDKEKPSIAIETGSVSALVE